MLAKTTRKSGTVTTRADDGPGRGVGRDEDHPDVPGQHDDDDREPSDEGQHPTGRECPSVMRQQEERDDDEDGDHCTTARTARIA